MSDPLGWNLASGFGALASAFLRAGDSAAMAGCARAPWHCLPAHWAALGRARHSPHRRSKDYGHVIAYGARSHSPLPCGVASAAPRTENRFPPQHAVSRPWPWPKPKLVSPRAMAPTDPGRVVPRPVPGAGSHKYPRDLALMPPGEAAACPAGRWALGWAVSMGTDRLSAWTETQVIGEGTGRVLCTHPAVL